MKKHTVSKQRRGNRIHAANEREISQMFDEMGNVRAFYEKDVLEKRKHIITIIGSHGPIKFTELVGMFDGKFEMSTVSVCLESLSDDGLIMTKWFRDENGWSQKMICTNRGEEYVRSLGETEEKK